MNQRAFSVQDQGSTQNRSIPVWAQDNRGLIANSDMLAIAAAVLVVIVIKAAAMIWRR